MAKTYFTVVSNGTWDTECLNTFADCSSCISSTSTIFFDCNCSTYDVSPASVFETDWLDSFYLIVICANYIDNPSLEPSFGCLVVSGGHTHLVNVKDYGEYEVLGRTRDDAAGEAFDKVARAVGLGYPGGPKIDKLAIEGNPDAIQFPRAKIADSVYDFSFSGIKSSVLNYLNQCDMKNETYNKADLVASFQKAVVDVLVDHAMLAVKEFGLKKLAIAGGVASNSALRSAMKEACDKAGIEFHHPSPILCTDNAAMIGAAGYYEYIKGNFAGLDLNAIPALKLGERL